MVEVYFEASLPSENENVPISRLAIKVSSYTVTTDIKV